MPTPPGPIVPALVLLMFLVLILVFLSHSPIHSPFNPFWLFRIYWSSWSDVFLILFLFVIIFDPKRPFDPAATTDLFSFGVTHLKWKFWESERHSVTHENSSRQTDSHDLCKAAVEDPAFSAAGATELSRQSDCRWVFSEGVASVGNLLKEYRCTLHVSRCDSWFLFLVGQSLVAAQSTDFRQRSVQWLIRTRSIA